MTKISGLLVCSIFLLSHGRLLLAAPSEKSKRSSIKEIVRNEDFGDESSIWESDPIEVDNVNIQILDKISGKVYRENIKLNSPKIFGSIELKLKRCYKNGPEDDKEISAFVEIREKEKLIFSNWIFASSPTVNLFSHPIYDIRVEF
ncbi:MAG: DUF2155 domain-containing protein [Holosporaceae bacterium]|nr:DUF2155 domain-containing protein [Holosporaceae bacterium]